MKFIFGLALLCVLFIGGGAAVRAQGGDGRSDSIKTVRKIDPKPRSRSKPKSAKPPKPKKPDIGKLELRISQGDSVIELTRLGDEPVGIEVITAAAESSSLIIRDLPVGFYRVVVRKPGYFEEDREFEIVRRKKKRIDLDLRPMSAVLSISSNVTDAVITIDGLGVFRSPLRNKLLRPGRYPLRVEHTGYRIHLSEIELPSPGHESKLIVVLELLPVEFTASNH